MIFIQENNNKGDVILTIGNRNTDILGNTESPHEAVIRVSYEIHDKLPSGELSGRIVDKASFLLRITGDTKSVCQQRISDFIAKMKKGSD